MSPIDIGHKVSHDLAGSVGLQRIDHHRWTEIGSTDSDTDYIGETAA